MKITRRQLHRLIREGVFGSSNKSVKEHMQDLVDEAPGKRALGEVDLKNTYYGDKAAARPAAIKDAQKKLGVKITGLHTSVDSKEIEGRTWPETGMMYSVVEKR